MKTSYVLMFNRDGGKVSRLTVTGGDPGLTQGAVLQSLEDIAGAEALSDKYGEIKGPHGYDRVKVNTTEFELD